MCLPGKSTLLARHNGCDPNRDLLVYEAVRLDPSRNPSTQAHRTAKVNLWLSRYSVCMYEAPADRSMWNFGMARMVFAVCISCDMLIIRLRDQGVHALLLRLLLVLSSTQHALIQVHRSPVHNRSILPRKAELRVYGSLLAHESSVIHALHKTRIPSTYSLVRCQLLSHCDREASLFCDLIDIHTQKSRLQVVHPTP